MKNITFVGGPLHDQDRILEDHETTWECYSPEEILIERGPDIIATGQMKVKKHFYKESASGSNIFIYVH